MASRLRDLDTYFMNIAFATAERSTCTRAQVGALLVQDGRIIATGYNGSPSGAEHCTDIGCRLENGHCVATVHAEENAILSAARHGIKVESASVYCTHKPCLNCTKSLINAGVREFVYSKPYDAGQIASHFIKKAGVTVRCVPDFAPILVIKSEG